MPASKSRVAPRPWLPMVAFGLAFAVVLLGAYVRLSDAGLGCPDWPGCYGHLVVPDSAAAQQHSPQRPLEAHKAWKEMAHRYAASTLGLLIVVLAARAWWRAQGRFLASLLAALVMLQGLLGMWTVTLLLKPLVVVGHLLGGFSVLALLWLICLQGLDVTPRLRRATATAYRLAGLGLAVVGMQVLLGGWTSANYAALACTGFPQCNGAWWPAPDFNGAFVLWHGLGVDYEGGILDSPTRLAIHLMHRMGALVTAGVVLAAAVTAARAGATRYAGAVLAALALQIGLGIANVSLYLPLPVAVAHNGGAALLVLTLVTLMYALHQGRRHD